MKHDALSDDDLMGLSMCPYGVTCVGGLFSFLFGMMSDLLLNNVTTNILTMSIAGGVGIAAGMAPGNDILLMKKADFLMMFGAVLVLSLLMNMLVPVDNMQNVFIVAMATNTAAGALRPVFLIPYSLVFQGSMKELLPSKNTC